MMSKNKQIPISRIPVAVENINKITDLPPGTEPVFFQQPQFSKVSGDISYDQAVISYAKNQLFPEPTVQAPGPITMISTNDARIWLTMNMMSAAGYEALIDQDNKTINVELLKQSGLLNGAERFLPKFTEFYFKNQASFNQGRLGVVVNPKKPSSLTQWLDQLQSGSSKETLFNFNAPEFEKILDFVLDSRPLPLVQEQEVEIIPPTSKTTDAVNQESPKMSVSAAALLALAHSGSQLTQSQLIELAALKLPNLTDKQVAQGVPVATRNAVNAGVLLSSEDNEKNISYIFVDPRMANEVIDLEAKGFFNKIKLATILKAVPVGVVAPPEVKVESAKEVLPVVELTSEFPQEVLQNASPAAAMLVMLANTDEPLTKGKIVQRFLPQLPQYSKRQVEIIIGHALKPAVDKNLLSRVVLDGRRSNGTYQMVNPSARNYINNAVAQAAYDQIKLSNILIVIEQGADRSQTLQPVAANGLMSFEQDVKGMPEKKLAEVDKIVPLEGAPISALTLAILAKNVDAEPQTFKSIRENIGALRPELNQKNLPKCLENALGLATKAGVVVKTLNDDKHNVYTIKESAVLNYVNKRVSQGDYGGLGLATILKNTALSKPNVAELEKTAVIPTETEKVVANKRVTEKLPTKSDKIIPLEKASISAVMLAMLAKNADGQPQHSRNIQAWVQNARPDLGKDKIQNGLSFALGNVTKNNILLKTDEDKKRQLYQIANPNMVDFINTQVAAGNYALLTPAEILKHADLPQKQSKLAAPEIVKATNQLKEEKPFVVATAPANENTLPAKEPVVETQAPDKIKSDANEANEEKVLLTSAKQEASVVEAKKDISLEQLADMPVIYGVAFSTNKTFVKLQLLIANESQSSQVYVEDNRFSGDTISSYYQISSVQNNAGYHILGSHELSDDPRATEYSYMFRVNQAEIETKSVSVVEKYGYGNATELTAMRMENMKSTAFSILEQTGLRSPSVELGDELNLADSPVADYVAIGKLLKKKRDLS